MDPNDASNYRCTLAKNGAKQYFFGKDRIAVTKIPKSVLPSIICAQKGEALVSERTQAYEARGTLAGVKKHAEVLKKKVEKKSPPKKSPPKRSPPKKSPPKRGISILPGEERARSPAGKPAVGRGGLAKKCTNVPSDYNFLTFFWQEMRQLSPTATAELVLRYEGDYDKYPYDDREVVLAPIGGTEKRSSARKSPTKKK